MLIVSGVLPTSLLVPLLCTGAELYQLSSSESFITVVEAAVSELLAVLSSGYSSFPG